MPRPFLKTYYRRGARILTPEQVEEIRSLKDKVPVYTLSKTFHIRQERVLDIWNNCERIQQGGAYNPSDIQRNSDRNDPPRNEAPLSTKKEGDQGDLYALMERDHIETEEAERESERFLDYG